MISPLKIIDYKNTAVILVLKYRICQKFFFIFLFVALQSIIISKKPRESDSHNLLSKSSIGFYLNIKS